MRRTKKQSLANTAAMAGRAGAGATPNWWQSFVPSREATTRLTQRDLAFILRNLATLTQNGVSLPKALGTLAEERAVGKHRDMILALRRHLENGESFSTALGHYGAVFDVIMVNQIKVGEHFVVLGERGTLALVKIHPDKFEELARCSYPLINYPAWTAPVLSRGRLYLRCDGGIVCLDIAPPAASR